MKPTLRRVKDGKVVEYQLASSRRLPVPNRTLREWIKRGEVNGLVAGRHVFLLPDEKLTKRLQVWKASMDAMVEHQNGAVQRDAERAHRAKRSRR